MKKRVILLAMALFFAVLFSRLYLLNPTKQLLGDTGDNYEYFSYQTLVHENIRNGRYPLAKTDSFRYPNGFELGYGSDGFLFLFSGAILQFVIPQPLTYNVTLVIILFFNFICAYLLFRELSGDDLSGVLGALMYGISPFVMARINAHINLATIGGIAYLSYALVYVVKQSIRKVPITFNDTLRVWIGALLTSLGSLQYALLICEVGFMAGFVALIVKPSLFWQAWSVFQYAFVRRMRLWITSFAVFLPIYLFFFYPYIWAILNGKITVFPKDLEECCRTKPLDIFLFNSYAGGFWSKINPSSLSIEKVVTIGILEWLLLVNALLWEKNRFYRSFLLLSVLLFCALSFGYIPLPLIPESWRSIAVFSLIFIGYITVHLSSFVQSKRGRIFVYFILIAVVVERLIQTIYISPPFPSKLFEKVRSLPGTAVLNIPLTEYRQFRNTIPYFTGKKIVDGYFHYTAESSSTLQYLNGSLLRLFKCPLYPTSDDPDSDVNRTLALLRENDIRTIVVHKDPKTEIFYHPSCDSMKDWWYYLNPPTLSLSQTVNNPTSYTFSLPKRKALKTIIFFPVDGTFVLYKSLIYPSALKEVWITLPDGSVDIPEWKPVENLSVGLLATFDKPLIVAGKAGQFISLSSPNSVDEPIFITLDYYFQKTGSQTVNTAIQSVYNDNEYEVYAIQN